jgi:hypothetical protein
MKLACAILIIGFLFAVHAQMPVFETGQYVMANGSMIDVGYYGSPAYYDWDGDGVKDLIVGQFSYGYVRFYKNNGTNGNPSYTTFQYLYADGSPISVYAS